MAKQNSVQMPGGFGGLTSFNEEYDSYFNLKPTSIILFVAAIVALRFGLKFYFG